MCKHLRYGITVDCDEAFLAWRSGDIERMRRALCLPTNAVDRNLLLSAYVERLFDAARQAPLLVEEAVLAAKLHVDELEFLLPELIREENISQQSLWLAARRRGAQGPWLNQESPAVAAYRYSIATFALLEDGLRRLGRHMEADQVAKCPAAVLYFEGLKQDGGNPSMTV